MKKITLLLLVFLISSCSPSSVGQNVLENIKQLSGKNQGLNRVIFQDSEKYVLLFNNGTRFGGITRAENDKGVADLLGSELRDCEKICEKNDGLREVSITRNCSESKYVNMHQACLSYENRISCLCSNAVNKTIVRDINLSEDEKQALIKAISEIIWVAPQ